MVTPSVFIRIWEDPGSSHPLCVQRSTASTNCWDSFRRIRILGIPERPPQNWNVIRSTILKVLCRDISHAFKPGAVRGLRGQLPNVPGAGSENELTDA